MEFSPKVVYLKEIDNSRGEQDSTVELKISLSDIGVRTMTLDFHDGRMAELSMSPGQWKKMVADVRKADNGRKQSGV